MSKILSLPMMTTHLLHSVAFTGHRYYAFEQQARLGALLQELYTEGFRHFISGMAVGFDLAAAEAVIELRSRCGDVTLECTVPYEGFERGFSPEDAERFGRIVAEADTVTCLAGRYSEGVFRRRNDYLVDSCSLVVAWWDGSRSGTGYTVARARRQSRPVVNLYPSLQLDLGL